jgi:hypothetical protein
VDLVRSLVSVARAPGSEPALPNDATSNSFLFFGILAGVAGAVSIVIDFLTPSASSAQQQLASFQGDPNGYVLYLFPLAFAFLVTPFFISLASVLRTQGSGLARVGPLVLLAGLFSLGVAGAFEYGGYWAISITPAPSASIQAYEAALWSTVNDAWTVVSIYGVGMGAMLLASALGQARDLPKWMATAAWVGAAIDLIGAVMASLSGYYSALSIGFLLPVVPLVILIVLSFEIPLTLRKRLAAPPASSPAV